MAQVTNISTGPRGAYSKGALVMAEVGETIEADDFAEEWFAEERARRGRPPASEATPEAE